MKEIRKRKRNRGFLWRAAVVVSMLLLGASFMGMGGFDIQVEPGSGVEYPRDWDMQILDEQQSWGESQWGNSQGDCAQGSGNQWDESLWEGQQWYDSRWSESQWEGNQWNAPQWDSGQWEGQQDDGAQWDGNTWNGNIWNDQQWNNGQTDNQQWNDSQWNGHMGNDYVGQEVWGNEQGDVQPRFSGVIPTQTPVPIPTRMPLPTPVRMQTPTPVPTPTPTPTPTSVPTLTLTPVLTLPATPTPLPTGITDSKRNTAADRYRDFSVEFIHEAEISEGEEPVIKLKSGASVQVLSLRLNGAECPWHWKEDTLVPETMPKKGTNKAELVVLLEGCRVMEMTPWIFQTS